jgi:Pycsar effector protein
VTGGQNAVLSAELAAVRAELVRVDGKCATLAALAGAMMAFLATQVSDHAPLPVRAVLGAAGLVLAAASIVLLVGVLRPRLGSTGFRRYAAMDTDQIRDLFTDLASTHTHQATRCLESGELKVLSQFAATKYLRLRLAVDLIAVGVVLTGFGLLAQLTT